MEIIETQPDPDTVVVALVGRLDASTVAQFDEHSRAWTGPRWVLLDFSGLTYLSSAGLRSLLILGRRQENVGRGFAVFAVPDAVRQVLTVAGFDRMIPMRATADDALQALTASP